LFLIDEAVCLQLVHDHHYAGDLLGLISIGMSVEIAEIANLGRGGWLLVQVIEKAVLFHNDAVKLPEGRGCDMGVELYLFGVQCDVQLFSDFAPKGVFRRFPLIRLAAGEIKCLFVVAESQ